ncbi:Cgr1-like [Babesia duncani]|uniref:Cgr1-like n=1 Tax=Babesia duncani TaxID=323732 RepID=A0AAD9PNW4_9APIC|nr:Cgr1-like [Babesia duncani]
MVKIAPELSIKGTALSGRPWKGTSTPVRAITNQSIKKTKEKAKSQWLKSQRRKEAMQEIAKESSELIAKEKELRKLKSKKLKEKRLKQQENEIRAAGNNLIIVSNAKVAKMSKSAKKKLTKLTPEIFSKIIKRR